VESFNTFYEKFSFDPREWFTSPEVQKKLTQNEISMNLKYRRSAHENFKKLKDVTSKLGYTIHKHPYDYQNTKKRKIGLMKPNPKDYGASDIPYINVLFTLAHEVGHALQVDYTKEIRSDFYTVWRDEYIKSPKGINDEELISLEKLYYELDAWVRGMEYIPTELKAQYKKYAYGAYKTYMRKFPKYYNSDMLLRNLLYKLNFDENVS